ncbi:hypothetical protein ACERK3_16280 [Phycisphaerales bacterium AB-hyl4]|uniref:Uncharacterized protein n=1 Tax=Natronomicrosphaera hydrolytica TaxID=3242702 RepID=A0ABV4U983_9BACT
MAFPDQVEAISGLLLRAIQLGFGDRVGELHMLAQIAEMLCDAAPEAYARAVGHGRTGYALSPWAPQGATAAGRMLLLRPVYFLEWGPISLTDRFEADLALETMATALAIREGPSGPRTGHMTAPAEDDAPDAESFSDSVVAHQKKIGLLPADYVLPEAEPPVETETEARARLEFRVATEKLLKEAGQRVDRILAKRRPQPPTRGMWTCAPEVDQSTPDEAVSLSSSHAPTAMAIGLSRWERMAGAARLERAHCLHLDVAAVAEKAMPLSNDAQTQMVWSSEKGNEPYAVVQVRLARGAMGGPALHLNYGRLDDVRGKRTFEQIIHLVRPRRKPALEAVCPGCCTVTRSLYVAPGTADFRCCECLGLHQ